MGEIKVNQWTENDVFFCSCASTHHNFVISEILENHDLDPDELCIQVHLNIWQGLFKRIWTAIKFIFKKIPYNCYDGVILEYSEAERLRKSINKAVKKMKKRREEKVDIIAKKMDKGEYA